MPGKKRKAFGCAEIRFRMTKELIDDNYKLSELTPKDYYSVLPSPIPLQEIDSPVDIYGMYHDGALLIGSKELDDKKEVTKKEYLINLPRDPKHGDIILIHFNNTRTTHCFMIVDPVYFDSDKLKSHSYFRNNKYSLGLIDLGKHENFQDKWSN